MSSPSLANDELAASVVISTYNRAEALEATLSALDRQDTPADQFEVIVVDDGSDDDTWVLLERISTRYSLRAFRHAHNRGVSAGRNTGIRHAGGRCLIFLSDDLIVSENFIRTHVSTLERFPGSWVVGGFEQLVGIAHTPFGRYLDRLERGFAAERTREQIGPDLWTLDCPTARNLSIPRSLLEQIGPFDERFRTCCEDQDLAERAHPHRVRFIYNAAITCVHNDQSADLERYCRFQQRGARDTVLFCAKYPARHGNAPIAVLNSRPMLRDGVTMLIRKLTKSALSGPRPTRWLLRAVALLERCNPPERWLFRAYRMMIGLAIFRGWRQGLRDAHA